MSTSRFTPDQISAIRECHEILRAAARRAAAEQEDNTSTTTSNIGSGRRASAEKGGAR